MKGIAVQSVELFLLPQRWLRQVFEMRGRSVQGPGRVPRRLPAAPRFKTAKTPPTTQTHSSPDQPLHPSCPPQNAKKTRNPRPPTGPSPATTTRQQTRAGPAGPRRPAPVKKPANSADDDRRTLRRPAAVFVLSAHSIYRIFRRSSRGLFDRADFAVCWTAHGSRRSAAAGPWSLRTRARQIVNRRFTPAAPTPPPKPSTASSKEADAPLRVPPLRRLPDPRPPLRRETQLGPAPSGHFSP